MEPRMCEGCPFDFYAEQTEIIQNYGCLPTPHEIIQMRQLHGKSWACHSDVSKPCVGAICHQRSKGLEFRVMDAELITESHDWPRLTTA